MNLSEIRDLIRAEANIQGLGEYTNLIDNLINNELQRITGKSKYTELLEEETYTLAAAEEFEFTLPADFQLFNEVRYSPETVNPPWAVPYPLTQGKETLFISEGYKTQYWFRKGNVFQVYPYSELVIGDQFILSYYKRPELLADADIFPVASLANVVQLYVMARMMRLRDTKASLLMKAEADQAYKDSRSEAAGS